MPKVNRRKLLKGALAGAAVGGMSITGTWVDEAAAAPDNVFEAPDNVFAFHKIPRLEQIAVLPIKDGVVVSMCTFQDDVYIATEHGTIYRLSDLRK